MRYIPGVIASVVLICACRVPRDLRKPIQDITPPGTVKLADNLFIDYYECSNISYTEFLYWTRHIYGEKSPEFEAIKVNENGWNDLGPGYQVKSWYYLQHPAYRNCAVVNISYGQAKAFSNWRSDRVFEYILIGKKLIRYVPNPSKDSVFTTQRYFNGQYQGRKPDKSITHYPVYSLPDSNSFAMAERLADSLNRVNIKWCKMDGCSRQLLSLNCFDKLTGKNDSLPYGFDPIAPTYCPFGRWRERPACKRDLITHLRGNAAEMTDIEGLAFGGSFMDSCATIKRQNLFKYKASNCYTGFRNICTYKKR